MKFEYAIQLPTLTHIQGDSNYSWFHFTDRPSILYAHTLLNFESDRRAAVLPEFVRVHKSYLVNPVYMASIKRVNRAADRPKKLASGGTLLLMTGNVVPVAPRRYKQVQKIIKNQPQPSIEPYECV